MRASAGTDKQHSTLKIQFSEHQVRSAIACKAEWTHLAFIKDASVAEASPPPCISLMHCISEDITACCHMISKTIFFGGFQKRLDIAPQEPPSTSSLFPPGATFHYKTLAGRTSHPLPQAPARMGNNNPHFAKNYSSTQLHAASGEYFRKERKYGFLALTRALLTEPAQDKLFLDSWVFVRLRTYWRPLTLF